MTAEILRGYKRAIRSQFGSSRDIEEFRMKTLGVLSAANYTNQYYNEVDHYRDLFIQFFNDLNKEENNEETNEEADEQ